MYLKHLRPYQLTDAVAQGHPLLVPAGCIETHGPHMAIGHDTLIVEEICDRVVTRTPCVIAPSFDYGPTGYALGGPADGTIDPDYDAFGGLAKSILRNFIEMGFRKTYVIIMHQGMGGPLALAFSKAAAELAVEKVLAEGHPRGWWGDRDALDRVGSWGGHIEVQPMILPESSPPAGGDHAGYNETSFLIAARPELVEQDRLGDDPPWYCQSRRNQKQLHGQRRARPSHDRGRRRCVGSQNRPGALKMTQVLTVHPDRLKGRHIQRAAEVLRQGGVIVYPTDTIYGLGCDITNKQAIERVQRIKGRDKKKPMSFVCADLTHISDYARVSNYAHRILKHCLPGAYTFVLPATRQTPRILQTKQKTVGLRIPDHPVPLALVRALGQPILSTSANYADQEVITEPWALEEELGTAGGFDLGVRAAACGGFERGVVSGGSSRDNSRGQRGFKLVYRGKLADAAPALWRGLVLPARIRRSQGPIAVYLPTPSAPNSLSPLLVRVGPRYLRLRQSRAAQLCRRRLEQGVAWSDSNSTQSWGLFTAAPGLGFGMINGRRDREVPGWIQQLATATSASEWAWDGEVCGTSSSGGFGGPGRVSQ